MRLNIDKKKKKKGDEKAFFVTFDGPLYPVLLC